jgi:hypothetical protein
MDRGLLIQKIGRELLKPYNIGIMIGCLMISARSNAR